MCQPHCRQSYQGWHDLVLTIDGSSTRYYIDGQLLGTHDAAYLPERPMSINFNQWLIDLAGRTGTTARAYHEQVDYVLHVKGRVLSPAQVAAAVAKYRSAGTTFEDTVPTSCTSAAPAPAGGWCRRFSGRGHP